MIVWALKNFFVKDGGGTVQNILIFISHPSKLKKKLSIMSRFGGYSDNYCAVGLFFFLYKIKTKLIMLKFKKDLSQGLARGPWPL